MNLGLGLVWTGQKVRLGDNPVQKKDKKQIKTIMKSSCSISGHTTWSADLSPAFILFIFFFFILFTDTVSLKGLGPANCPASAVLCYFIFTAWAECRAIPLSDTVLLDWNNSPFYKQFWSWQESLKIILVPENTVKHIKTWYYAKQQLKLPLPKVIFKTIKKHWMSREKLQYLQKCFQKLIKPAFNHSYAPSIQISSYF